MEGHRAHLEGEAHEDEEQAHEEQLHVRFAARDRRADAGEVGVSGGGVDQRGAEEEDRRGEGAEEEVLERALDGARAAAAEAGQRVHAQGHRLEPHEEGEHVGGSSEHHRAEGAEDEKDVELAALEAVLTQVATGEQRAQPTAEADGHVEEEAEPVGGQEEVEDLRHVDRILAADQGEEGDTAREEEGRRGDGGDVGPLLGEGVGEHHEEPTEDQEQKRGDGNPGAHRTTSRAAPGCCRAAKGGESGSGAAAASSAASASPSSPAG